MSKEESEDMSEEESEEGGPEEERPEEEGTEEEGTEEEGDTVEEGTGGDIGGDTGEEEGEGGEDTDCEEYLHPDTTDRMSARIISRLIDMSIF